MTKVVLFMKVTTTKSANSRGKEESGQAAGSLKLRRRLWARSRVAAAGFSLFQEQESGAMAGGAGKRSKHPRARTGTATLQAHTRPDETLEAATREEETRKSYEEDRVKQQADRRIPVLEEEVAALTQEVSQSEVRAKLQKRDRTEASGKDPACELPSKKACVDRRASGASEQGASSNPDLPTAYEQNDVSELVGRLREMTADLLSLI